LTLPHRKDGRSVAGGWFLTFLHSPVAGYWIIITVMTVAAVIDVFRKPHEALELFSAIALVGTLVKFVARRKGVSPWPFRLDDDDDDDDVPPLLDAIGSTPMEVRAQSRENQS
jgi:hypothetical protein